MSQTKYIFITGGVVSSLGKGIISASIGKLLQARGFRVTIQKFDPYINIDPGTLNPYEHGECYVTMDGMETDLDLGHYERFTGIHTTRNNSVTTGRIYKTVIDRERRGDYLGKTIQVVPHITDEIKRRMLRENEPDEVLDFVITEVGGTIGDIESAPFMEAIRQLKWQLGRNVVNVHLTYVPYLKAAEEMKTKPTQHSVKELQGMGIQPDILVLRTEHHLDEGLREMYRVLKPGGQVTILEFSYPTRRYIRVLYDFYFSNVLPTIGRIVSRDKTAYTYLNKSVKSFCWGEAFAQHLHDAGFSNEHFETLTLGIATIYTAIK